MTATPTSDDAKQTINDLCSMYNGSCDENQAEMALLETLSAVAALQDSTCLSAKRMWKILTALHHADDDSFKAIVLISKLIRRMSPLEVHAAATQALVFCNEDDDDGCDDDDDDDDETTHNYASITLCILLCTWSLTQYPSSPPPKRWKRWQSILCETVKHFQNRSRRNSEMWFAIVLPVCRNMQLPKAAQHDGIKAGLVGTSLLIVSDNPQEATKCLAAFLEKDWISPTDILKHHRQQTDGMMNDVEDKKSCLAQRAFAANQDDVLAGMDTSWSERGVAVLAAAFIVPARTTQEEDQWSTFFPHISTLLFDEELTQAGLQLLQSLLTSTPTYSVKHWHAVDCPVGTLQLLANQVVAASVNQNQVQATLFISIMQNVVSKYSSERQVEIIRKLLRDCPHAGLKPKLVDLLQPLVELDECNQLWEYILQKFLQKMQLELTILNTAEKVNDFIGMAETYASVAHLVQRYLMLRDKLPSGMEGQRELFATSHERLVTNIEEWRVSGESPSEMHRLNLLQLTLSRIMELLVEAPKA